MAVIQLVLEIGSPNTTVIKMYDENRKKNHFDLIR